MIKVHKASEFLKTPEDVAAYLNATIEEMDDPRLLMKAFRNIAETQSGVSELSRRAMNTAHAASYASICRNCLSLHLPGQHSVQVRYRFQLSGR